MPEGPEVLTIVDGLYFYLNGKTIKSLNFLSGKYSTCTPEYYEEFIDSLPIKVVDVWCKGKCIIFYLKNEEGKEWWILNSLRMTGKWEFTETTHTRLHISMKPTPENGVFDVSDIYYNDVRSLGTFEFIESRESLNYFLNELKCGFIGRYIIDLSKFSKNIKNCKASLLTSKLSDQRGICSGIGNYLISEIMYDCRFHPQINCSDLSRESIEILFNSCKTIISESYYSGGMSMKDYNGIDGGKGDFASSLKVYGRRGVDINGQKITTMKKSNGQTLWYVPERQTKKK
jgi:formamidopyrimidine-DNA glycosylase